MSILNYVYDNYFILPLLMATLFIPLKTRNEKRKIIFQSILQMYLKTTQYDKLNVFVHFCCVNII